VRIEKSVTIARPVEEVWDFVADARNDAPHRLRWREEDADAVFNVLYELEPTGSGTQIKQVDDIEWKIGKAALPIARLMVSRDISRQFRSLKRLLETA
jgi:hypothetical protein